MSSAFTARPEIRGTFGVVSSTHWLASQVAMGVLERGGNAFDAAAAGGFALQIVEPHLNGPGGEVPILFWSEDEQRMRALCGQGPAPALATPAYFRGLGLDLVPGIGLLPATVPGAFSAWLTLLRDYGTWELADVLAPAIAYARDGFPLVPRISQAILAVQALFRDEWTSSAEVWLRNGRAPAPDALFRTPAIAATYTRIVEQAQAPAVTAAAASRPRCISGTKASSPTRSTPITHMRPCATPRASATTACCASPTSRSGGPAMTSRRPCSTATTPSPNAAPGRKAPCICNSWPSCATWAWTGWIRNHRSSCIASPKPPSSPSPTAPPGTAIPPSWRYPCRRC